MNMLILILMQAFGFCAISRCAIIIAEVDNKHSTIWKNKYQYYFFCGAYLLLAACSGFSVYAFISDMTIWKMKCLLAGYLIANSAMLVSYPYRHIQSTNINSQSTVKTS